MKWKNNRMYPTLTKIGQKLLPHLGAIVLSGLVFYLAIINHIPETWLTGWDNLHPEFDLKLAWEQSINSAWQGNEGLGVVRGMALAADATRLILLWFISLLVSQNNIRYVWVFLMLAVGSVGANYLAQSLIRGGNSKLNSSLIGFVSGLAYISNLAMVQYFYVPFETFVGFYGFLPWFIMTSYLFLKNGGVKRLFYVVLTFALGASAFYVQTMFLVLNMVLGILALEGIVRLKLIGLKRSLILFSTIFLVNLYWLVPVIYFSATQIENYVNIKQINIATAEQQLMNQNRGGWGDLILLRGFWFDQTDLDENGQSSFLFEPWRSHLEDHSVVLVGYLVIVLAVFGLLLNLFLARQRWSGFILAFGGLSILMLTAGQGLLGAGFELVTSLIPILEQVFRSPFTKWSAVLALAISLGLAFFINSLVMLLRKEFSLVAMIVITPLLVYFIQPAFKGSLIYSQLQIQIPQSYFNLFDYLKSQPDDRRILYLPVESFWGWHYYQWGYRGSGFLWHGIRQPILHRSFDAWSHRNETAYYQFKQAIDRKDFKLFTDYLEKYRIEYIILDSSLFDSRFNLEGESMLAAKEMIKGIGQIVWESEPIQLYQVNNANSNDTSTVEKEYFSVKQLNHDVVTDKLWEHKGNYVSGISENASSYPFASVFKYRNLNDVVIADENSGGLRFTADVSHGEVTLPPYSTGEQVLMNTSLSHRGNELVIEIENPISVSLNGEDQNIYQTPLLIAEFRELINRPIWVSIGGRREFLNLNEKKQIKGIEIEIGQPLTLAIYDYLQFETIDLRDKFDQSLPYKCWERQNMDGEVRFQKKGNEMEIITRDAAGCLSLSIPLLPNDVLVQVSLPFVSVGDSRPNFCLVAEGPEYRCLHTEVFYGSDPSPDWAVVERQVELESNTQYWIDITARPSDMVGQRWSIVYRQPNFTYYPLIDRFTFDNIIWSDFSQEKTLEIDGDKSLEILFLTNPIETNHISNDNQWYQGNCDPFERGEIEKIFSDNGAQYLAKELGAMCDFTILDAINPLNNYLIKINSKNISGRPLKIYMNDLDNNSVLLEELLSSDESEKYYGIFTNLNVKSPGYKLTLENRSFGGPSQNQVGGVEIYPFPSNWLSLVKNTTIEGEYSFYHANIISTEKVNSAKTIIELSSSSNDTIFDLGFGYDRGWIAQSGSNFSLSRPFIKHVETNSWSNAWIIPSGTSKVLLIFWPQYLQWLAIIIAGLSGLILGIWVVFVEIKNILKNRKIFN